MSVGRLDCKVAAVAALCVLTSLLSSEGPQVLSHQAKKTLSTKELNTVA